MISPVTIYVALVDEGVEAWRPVFARSLGGGAFEILAQPYDRDIERWEFEPGERVICLDTDLEGERLPVATMRLAVSQSVEFPSMRSEVMDALMSLSDRAYQQREWGMFDEERGRYDDLTLNIHLLYDDCRVLPDPLSMVGSVLYEEDVVPLQRLGEVLGPMIDDLRDSDDGVYTEDPRWAGVVAAAGRALASMRARP